MGDRKGERLNAFMSARDNFFFFLFFGSLLLLLETTQHLLDFIETINFHIFCIVNETLINFFVCLVVTLLGISVCVTVGQVQRKLKA